MTKNEEHFSTREAAEFLHLSAHTIRNARSTGTLCGRQSPPYIKMGGKVLYARTDLLHWLNGFTKYNNTSQEISEARINEKRH